MEILVFRTSVREPEEVHALRPLLNAAAGEGQWNFDLWDCDGVLRIVSQGKPAIDFILLLNGRGFFCEELEDIILTKSHEKDSIGRSRQP